ncbi:F-box domain containing protein [Tanacetum coccineum]
MESSRWTDIYEGINMHLQKAYNTNMASFKAKHWKVDPQTGTYDVEAIRRARPEEITVDEWDNYIRFWNDPKNLARAAQNRQNRQKRVVISRQGSRSLARLRDEMVSDTQEYPSLIDTFWRTHIVDRVFPKDEDHRIYPVSNPGHEIGRACAGQYDFTVMSSADVARSQRSDGDGGDRPPPPYVPTGCGGCFINRGKGKRNPNLGGKGAGRLNTRDKTRNLSLKEIAEAKGPVSIHFDVGDKQTLNPLGPHEVTGQDWKVDSQSCRTYDVEAIRRARPEEITADEWDNYIRFWNDPKNLARAAQNRQNRQKSVESGHIATGIRSWSAFEM